MDFFQRQDAARRTTKWLVVYFIIAVLGILLAVNLVVGLIFSGTGHSRHLYRSDYRTRTYDPSIFGFATLGTLLVIFCGSTYKTLQLSSGGSAVAEMMGGRPVDANTNDPDERKLLNVVEEMSIASGTPVPQVYVMDDEPGINAFAAGHSTKDMVICATRGCLRLLTRDELQGVIGHEFSHILNGDMRLNLRLMGLVFGILCIAICGRILMDQRGSRYRDRDRDRNSLFGLGIALFIIGWIGVFFGNLIKSAVSRQREFLADAASVQFTRNPAGLASALKKVGGCGSRIEDPNAEEASHLFFANGLSESFSNLFSTHPPLEERIKRLDPSFDGQFTAVNLYDAENQIQEQMQPAAEVPPRIVRAPQLADLIGGQRTPVGGMNAAAPTMILSDTIGAPTSQHLDYAADLRSKLPQDLDRAARDPMSAVALVYAILLSPEEGMRTKQLQQLQPKIDPAIYQETLRLMPSTLGLESRSKLPLATIAMTALRRLSPSQYTQFTRAMQFVIESDEQIELFEYALQKMVRRHLEPNYVPPRKPMVQYFALKALVPECEVLLSALAYAGQTESGQIESAFRKGVQQLKLPQMNLLPASGCGLKEVDAALEKLNQTAPPLKRSILDACAETVAADGVVQEEEAELLRAIADSLDCPVPPMISLA